MSSTAQELVECAVTLLQSAGNEPQFRTVCSRAYYGAFHAAQTFHRQLRAPGSVGGARGSHEQLIAQLRNPMIRRHEKEYDVSVEIGLDLKKLFDVRVIADYRLLTHIDADLAHQSTNLAVKILRSAA
jgi:uncharacterized protein (UPF0332 family)